MRERGRERGGGGDRVRARAKWWLIRCYLGKSEVMINSLLPRKEDKIKTHRTKVCLFVCLTACHSESLLASWLFILTSFHLRFYFYSWRWEVDFEKRFRAKYSFSKLVMDNGVLSRVFMYVFLSSLSHFWAVKLVDLHIHNQHADHFRTDPTSSSAG